MKPLLIDLSNGTKAFSVGCSMEKINCLLSKWRDSINDFIYILILAGSRTSEVEGISCAGSTPEARRYTAIADAEIILNGPLSKREWPLPPLPAGVSPALISFVASEFLEIKPVVITAGLLNKPPFPHLAFDSFDLGPAACLSSGKSMKLERVEKLWNEGLLMGLNLKKPLLLTECVPGGTTTAQAVLSALGLDIAEFISSSALNPPFNIKKELVKNGLESADLGLNPFPKNILAAVGDPFQVIAVGLLIGARKVGQPVLLGGGSQMISVLALALASIEAELREEFTEEIAISTTSWLVEESSGSFLRLMEIVSDFFNVDLLAFISGLRFHGSRKKVLQDYEVGYVKEGVGAGALSFLTQLKGINLNDLIKACEEAVDKLELMEGRR